MSSVEVPLGVPIMTTNGTSLRFWKTAVLNVETSFKYLYNLYRVSNSEMVIFKRQKMIENKNFFEKRLSYFQETLTIF